MAFLDTWGYRVGVVARTILPVATDAAAVDAVMVLTPRERDVMERAAHGLTNARIAAELSVSTHAVKFHLASVYRKLGVANRTEATAIYVTALGREIESVPEGR